MSDTWSETPNSDATPVAKGKFSQERLTLTRLKHRKRSKATCAPVDQIRRIFGNN